MQVDIAVEYCVAVLFINNLKQDYFPKCVLLNSTFMSAQDTVFSNKIRPIFDQNSGPFIMGILNVTPDSFYDGARYNSVEKALKHSRILITEGADIIDIGGYSTRPGAAIVSEEEELQRLIPVIRAIHAEHPDTLLSVDTFRASVAEQAAEAGATIINDVSGGELDPRMFDTVAKLQLPYILMHMQGNPATMQDQPEYTSVSDDVFRYLEMKLRELQKKGVNQVIVDPGFGFGKSIDHNYELLRDLSRFNTLNCPVLVGVSRKSMITKLLNINAINSLNASSALHLFALLNGAKILRVHDVKPAREMILLYEKLKRNQGV